jgi:hypothetical protein
MKFASVLLIAQLVGVVHARFVPARYFCWAPFDTMSTYTIHTTIDGRDLSPAEIKARYHKPAHQTDQRSIRAILDIVEQYETTYGKADNASVRVEYVTNGQRPTDWRFPTP